MKDISLIVDANLLIHGLYPLSRRGLFFVAYNLINELSKKKNIKLHFYLNNGWRGKRIKELIKKEWPYLKCGFYDYKPLLFFNLYKKYSNRGVFSWFLKKIIDYQKNKQKSYLNHYIKKNGCEVFLSLYFKIPGIIHSSELKKFTVVYDFIPFCIPEYFCQSELESLKLQVGKDLYNDKDYYFTISENTRKDFIKYIRTVNKNHIYTSYISCSESFIPQKLTEKIRSKYNIPHEKKYVFTLFTVEKRKNIERILRTFSVFLKKNSIDDLILVVGGAVSSDATYLTNINNSNIFFTGFLNDEDLPALYSNADFFIYTSLYEGFGLPPLEAMKCGCPVVVSNSSSLPEVVGDAGIQVDCYSDEQHIAAYEKYYYDREYRDNSVKKGFIQAQKFSWKKTADFIEEKIRETLY